MICTGWLQGICWGYYFYSTYKLKWKPLFLAGFLDHTRSVKLGMVCFHMLCSLLNVLAHWAEKFEFEYWSCFLVLIISRIFSRPMIFVVFINQILAKLPTKISNSIFLILSATELWIALICVLKRVPVTKLRNVHCATQSWKALHCSIK